MDASGSKILRAKTWGRRMNLFDACEVGNLETVKNFLSDPHLDVNITNKEGLTPLLIACAYGRTVIVELLLKDKRVDVNKDHLGLTPFASACRYVYTEIVKLFLENERVDVNRADDGGRTPFFMACFMGHTEIVQLLLQYPRVDVHQKNTRGFAPLAIAQERGYTAIAKLLQSPRPSIGWKDLAPASSEAPGKGVLDGVTAIVPLSKEKNRQERS